MANYQITGTDDLAGGGAKTKARKNIAAIRLLKDIEQEQRSATAAEQAILIRYVGWGPAADIFTTKPEWAALRNELEDALTEEEFAAARASTINAFYTDVSITSAIYEGIERFGFTGGTVLDPSMGATGIFEGMMPTDMARRSEISGVELDSISGRIATQLYPESTVYVQGFQDVILPDDYFDLTISNVPFSEVGVKDPRYKGQPVNTLHDYFFAKGLDKVRPGGLVAYITSTGTMQSAKGEPFREYLSDHANLVGAMRLPGDAFKKNAGTEVTTDLVILQKLGNGVESNGIAWTALAETNVLGAEGKPLRTNEYYAQRPELMLGELCDDKLYPGRLALKGDGRDISEAIKQAFQTMPAAIYQPQLNLKVEDSRILVPPELQDKVKQNAFTLHDGGLMVREGDYLKPSEAEGKRYERVIGLMNIKGAVQKVFDVQLKEGTDAQLEAAQSELSEVYDEFVKKNGYINTRGNKLAFNKDPDYPLLLALEKYDLETKTATKTDIFSKRTIQAYKPRTHADNAKEGLLFSLNELGKVDIGYIAQLTSKSRLEVVLELQKEQLIYRDPVAQEWQTQDEYLSGNVRHKLEIAQAAAATDSQFTLNVEALEAVQPEPLLPGDIDVRLGSVWVPGEDVEVFTKELLSIEEGVNVHHSASTNRWYVNASYSVNSAAKNTDIYGSGDVKATQLIELTLNLKDPTLYTTDSDGNRVVDQEATAAARLKQEEIKEKFKDWVWKDPERTARLTDKYNATFNTNRARQYDGSHLALPGKNPNFVLRKHQANAVYRSLSGNMLLAHVVGAGKTAEMICSAMEQKRLGLANKPMFVVPNHLLEQWAGEIKHLYPTADILAATKKDAAKANRQQLMSRIATGQWDAVVVTHTAFEKLQLSNAAQTEFLKEESLKVREAILSISGTEGEQSRRVMKDLERKQLALEARIGEVANSDRKDNTITFEQLGIDLLLVDESHYFKNLGYVTKMQNVAGLPNSESKRAFDMHMKVRYMAQVRGEGKGVIFATGTPIANSMAELYTVQRYLQPKELERMGLASFDDWASVFGETVTSAELAATGKFQVKTRFSSFVNLPELMGNVRQVMDIQTADMLKLPVPELLGGKPTVVAVPATDDQLAYMESLVRRAENMGSVDPREDNMLKLTSNGRAASADMRLLYPGRFDDPNSKINRFVRDAFDFWDKHGSTKTHLVFCELGTPKKAGEFSLYQDIKDKLVERGVPADVIAFAQDYGSDAKKLELQQKFNQGKIAILISGAQLETGFNGQKKLALISHLTVPWRPDQIEQRDGRMIRQGNQNDVVESRRYVTQGRNGQPGMDGYFWQALETKAGFISQIMRGSSDIRRMDDVSTEQLNYSEVKAIATGNPLIMEKATLDNTIRKLSTQKRAHTNAAYRNRQELDALPGRIERIERELKEQRAELRAAQEARASGKITLFGRSLSLNEQDEIGKRIRTKAATLRKLQQPSVEEIGALGSFKLYIHSEGQQGASWATRLRIQGQKTYFEDSILGSNQGAYDALAPVLDDDIERRLRKLEAELPARQQDLKDLSELIDTPFSKDEELAAAVKRLAEVHEGLKVSTKSQSQEAGSLRQVAPPEQQTTGATSSIAKFLIAQGLERSVLSGEGFYLTMPTADQTTELVIDADGKQLSFETDIQGDKDSLETKGVTAVFQVDDRGLLTLESALSTSHPDTDKELLALRLAQYVARTQYAKTPEVQSNAPTQAVSESKDQGKGDLTQRDSTTGGNGDRTTIQPTTEAKNRDTGDHTTINQPTENTGDRTRTNSSTENRSDRTTAQATTEGNDKGNSDHTQDDNKTQAIEEDPAQKAIAPEAQPVVQPSTKQQSPTTAETSQQQSGSRSDSLAEEVTLVIQSIHSGNEEEITLPPIEQTSRPKDGKADTPSTQQQAKDTDVYKGKYITVSREPQKQGIEVRFAEKPPEEWTDHLNRLRFRFTKKGGDPRWYRKESKVSISVLTAFADRYEKVATPQPDIKPVETKALPSEQQTPDKKRNPVSVRKPEHHRKQAEKNAATFIHAASLTSLVMKDMHISVTKEGANTLFIKSHTAEDGRRLLSLSQLKPDDSNTFDSEATFLISSSGMLQLEETASAHMLDGSKLRQPGGDRLLADLLTQNIVRAGYDERLIGTDNPRETKVEAITHTTDKTEAISASKQGETLETPSQVSSAPPEAATESINSRTQPIKAAKEQAVLSAQKAAQFLHDAGLVEKLAQGDRFRLKVSNGVFNPLLIESTLQADGAKLLRISQQSQNDESAIACEATFTVSADGLLALKETASRNPALGNVTRTEGGSTVLADRLLSSILEKRYAEHIRQPSTSTKQEVSASYEPDTADQGVQLGLQIDLPTSAADTTATAHNQPKNLEPQPEAASSFFAALVQQQDPELHAELTSAEPTVSVTVEQLRDWYVAVQHHRAQASPESIEAIKAKGLEAAATGTTFITPQEANAMNADIKRFTDAHPKTTVENLRDWYRANLAGNGSYADIIKGIAQEAKAAETNSVQLRPTHQVRMDKEVGWYKAQVVSQIEPNLRYIWEVASTHKLTQPYAEDKAIFEGKDFSIVASQSNVLTLIHNPTERTLSIAENGDVLENSLTMDNIEEIKKIAQQMTHIVAESKRPQLQP